MERQEEKEKVLVPVRRQQEAVPEQEPLKEITEEPVFRPTEMPRRWYSYQQLLSQSSPSFCSKIT